MIRYEPQVRAPMRASAPLLEPTPFVEPRRLPRQRLAGLTPVAELSYQTRERGPLRRGQFDGLQLGAGLPLVREGLQSVSAPQVGSGAGAAQEADQAEHPDDGGERENGHAQRLEDRDVLIGHALQ